MPWDVTGEFGFNLHAKKNKGHFIGMVDKDGIGDLSGLCMGQRIVGVNGTLVYPQTPHKACPLLERLQTVGELQEVVALIKQSPLKTELLVASEDVDRWYKDHREEYSFDYIELISRRPTISEPISQTPLQLSPHVDFHLVPHAKAPFLQSITIASSDSAGSPSPTTCSSTSSSRSSSVAAVVPLVPVPVKVHEEEDRKHDQHLTAVVTPEQDKTMEEKEEGEEQTDEQTTVVEKSIPAPVHPGEDDLMASVFATVDPPQSHQHDGDDDDAVGCHHHHEAPVDVEAHEVHEDKNVVVAASPPLQPLHNNNNHNNNNIHQHHTTPVHHHHHHHQNEKANGVPGLSSDIFELSAAEARERLRIQNRRRDFRQQVLSMDEKHRVIANL